MKIIDVISKLDSTDKNFVNSCYRFTLTASKFELPFFYHQNYKKSEIKDLENQRSLRVDNKFIEIGAIYNSYRLAREKWIIHKPLTFDNTEGCPFCNISVSTPKEISKKANIMLNGFTIIPTLAKYDSIHSMVIFKDHNPYSISINSLKKTFMIAFEFFKLHYTKSDTYPLIYWTCPWKAPSSIHHGHCHLYLAQGKPYSKIGKYINFSENYSHSKYFLDRWIKIHNLLELDLFQNNEVFSFINITPIGNQEIVVIGEPLHDDFHHFLYNLLNALIYKLGVVHFSIIGFPLTNNASALKNAHKWVFEIVDRGHPHQINDNLNFQTVCGSNILSKDPYKLKEKILSSWDNKLKNNCHF